MWRIKAFLLILLIVAGVVLFYRYDMDWKKSQSRKALNPESGQKFEQVVSKVDDTAIIKKALKAIGVLSVLEGKEEYKQIIEEENWYSYRGINIDWHYRFAIAVNLQDVDINFKDSNVDVNIDKSKLFIQFIEKTKDSISNSEATLLAKKYSSQEISALEKAVVQKVEDKIMVNEGYWEDAMKSLEVNIKKICNDLGYYNINFMKKGTDR